MNAIVGDTIRIPVTFYDLDVALADPTTVTVSFYDINKVQIGAAATLDAGNKDSVGVYHYDYTVPDGHSKIYYEFTGIMDTLPNIERGEIRVTWL